MRKRAKYGNQRLPAQSARAARIGSEGEPSDEVQRFKRVYVLERRHLDYYRTGEESKYKPPKSWDGESQWDTPEVPASGRNEWIVAYNKIVALDLGMEPEHYLRVLFHILRGSSLYVPTVKQLSAPATAKMVLGHETKKTDNVSQQLRSETQRAKMEVKILTAGSGYSTDVAVYYTLASRRVGLSPLYKYCLASETVRILSTEGQNCENIERLEEFVERNAFLAAMDYMVFPDVYDDIWGDLIPKGFRKYASELLEKEFLGSE